MNARRRIVTAVSAAVVSMSMLAACGSSDTGAVATNQISIEVGPSFWETPVRVAIEKGWFEEAGLTVTAVPYGPESSLPLVLNGQADIGVTGLGTVITMAAKGMPIQAVAGQLVEGESRDQQLTGVVGRSGSGVTSLKDLEGKTVATNELKGPSSAQVIRRMSEDGGDPSKVQWVAIPFPGMVEAMNRGDVQAAVASQPFLDQLLAAGGNYVSRVSRTGTPVPTYFAKNDFYATQPEKAKKFREVVEKAYAWANANRDEAMAAFAKDAGIPLEAAMKLPAMRWSWEMDRSAVDGNISDMKAAGFLEGDITYDKLVMTPLQNG